MSKKLTWYQLPGEDFEREIIDEKTRKAMEQLKDVSTGEFATLIKNTIGLYVDENGYLCQDPQIIVPPLDEPIIDEEEPQVPDFPPPPPID